MAEIWIDAPKIRDLLIDDGWRSPDTYCNYFEPITSDPAVYLFLLHRRGEYDKAFVAYVGMSIKLNQRMRGHPILVELNADDYWPMRWFKPTPKPELRDVERKYITQFNPPWNIVGRPKGVLLS